MMLNTRVSNFPNCDGFFSWIMIVQIMHYMCKFVCCWKPNWSLPESHDFRFQISPCFLTSSGFPKQVPLKHARGDTVERKPLNLLKVFKMRLLRSSSVSKKELLEKLGHPQLTPCFFLFPRVLMKVSWAFILLKFFGVGWVDGEFLLLGIRLS